MNARVAVVGVLGAASVQGCDEHRLTHSAHVTHWSVFCGEDDE